MLSLESKGLQLEVVPERGSYALRLLENPKILIDEAWLAYQLELGKPIYAEFLELRAANPLRQAGPGGTQFSGFALNYHDKLHKVEFAVELGLMLDQPMLLVRERLMNKWAERNLARKIFCWHHPAQKIKFGCQRNGTHFLRKWLAVLVAKRCLPPGRQTRPFLDGANCQPDDC